MKWEDLLDIGGLTDVGMRRSNNQDAFRTLPAHTSELWQRRGHFFVVADGMGAHAVGELASKLAVDAILHTYHKLTHLSCSQAITKSFQDTNLLIHNRGTANKEFHGMGTTSTALLLMPEGAIIAHVGDSRAYRVRDGQIRQISFDHSLAWELVRRRHLTPDQARSMVPSNVITRSLGPEPEVQVDIEGPLSVQAGDVFVLCSDGLSGQVGDAEIGALARSLPAQDACQYLVDMANLRGGPDNITVVVVRVGGPPADAQKSDKPAPRRLQIPWRSPKFWMLIAGAATLACCALGLLLLMLGPKLRASGIALLSVGGVGLLADVAGIIWYRSASRRRVAEPLPEEPAGYRPPTNCALDDALFERLRARLDQLRAAAVEHAWNMEWSEFFAHRNGADKRLETGDRVGTLRELCQAIHLLAIAQRRSQESTQGLLGR